jgi:hypothetical protein
MVQHGHNVQVGREGSGQRVTSATHVRGETPLTKLFWLHVHLVQQDPET